MKNIELYENFNQRTMIIKHRNFGEINVRLQGSRIEEVTNQSNVNFPFAVGASWNRSIESWACNNNFIKIETWMNNRMVKQEDPCPEEKIFGVRTKDVPQGHEWRRIFPNKFKR
jgi:hypothetical protein